MRIPRFWTSADVTATAPDGRSFSVRAFGWSDVNVVEAGKRAAEAVARLRKRIAAGEPFPERYAYAERPLREEIVAAPDLQLPHGRAIVTRNANGCLVINTAGVMFVDVDVPRPGFFQRLKQGLFRAKNAPAEAFPTELAAFVQSHSRARVRAYRTHSGWRYLMMHDTFDPTSARTREVLVALGADPKYVELTRVQESFRARLTPKPWRTHEYVRGFSAPGIPYPRANRDQDRAMQQWLAEYEDNAQPFATARFVGELGAGKPIAEAAAVAEYHDRVARATNALPLA